MKDQIKIVSYNIHNGGKEMEALLKNIRNFASQGVVIFCLQEFWKWMQPVDIEIKIQETLGPDWQMEYKTPNRPQHDWGACILWNQSVLKAVSFEHLALPLLPKPRLWEKLWIRLHGLGPEAFVCARGALTGTFDWNNRRLRVTNVHLDWQGGVKQRMTQLDYVKNYLTAHPETDHDIICGDFNSIGLNKTKQPKIFWGVLGNEFKNACDIPVVTCPPFSTDQMFVKGLRVVNFQVHKIPGSDHFPISVDLTA